jgi:hypothetical protein
MNTQAFTTVRNVRSQAEAGLLISILRVSGLHPLELETAGHCSLAGADVDYAVQVPTEQAAEARAILTAYDTKAA